MSETIRAHLGWCSDCLPGSLACEPRGGRIPHVLGEISWLYRGRESGTLDQSAKCQLSFHRTTEIFQNLPFPLVKPLLLMQTNSCGQTTIRPSLFDGPTDSGPRGSQVLRKEIWWRCHSDLIFGEFSCFYLSVFEKVAGDEKIAFVKLRDGRIWTGNCNYFQL